MDRMIRLKGRLHIGNRVFYKGDVINLDKYPEVETRLKEIREEQRRKKDTEKLARSPQDKMQRPSGYKTK